MKKIWIALALTVTCALCLTGCGSPAEGGETDAQRVMESTALYDEDRIEAAFDAVEEVFAERFPGCTLTELRYDDEVEARFENEIATYQDERGQELIILLSDFQTDENGGDGSLEPNSSYTDWQWYLVRDGDSADWEVLDWGY